MEAKAYRGVLLTVLNRTDGREEKFILNSVTRVELLGFPDIDKAQVIYVVGSGELGWTAEQTNK